MQPSHLPNYKKRLILDRLFRKSATLSTPESRLWFAVLLQAIHDLGDSDYRDTFFFETNSFKTICVTLDLDPDFVRETVEMVYQKPRTAA